MKIRVININLIETLFQAETIHYEEAWLNIKKLG